MTGNGTPISSGTGHEEPRRRKITDPTSPYYLSSSDSPGQNICGFTLKGEGNYRQWATAMKNAFRAKRKNGFVDGSITRPTEHNDDIEDWISINSTLVGWVMTAIDSSLRSNIAYMDDVHDLWDDLKARFAIGDSMRIYELKDMIRGCRQNGDSISVYYGRLKTLWDEYDEYRVAPKCVCTRCTCDLARQFAKQIENEKGHDFLLGLDTEIFGTLRSNILSQEDLPALTKLYNMFTQEERHRNMMRGREERTDAVAFATGPSSFPVRSEQKVVCTFCKKPGHEIDQCFKRTGKYPDWWYDNPGKGRGGRGRGAGRGRGKAVANAVCFDESPGSNVSQVGTQASNISQPSCFSDEQWRGFLQLMETCKASSVSAEKLTGPAYEDADWSG
ncbi:unnamed protein product [Cuscuta epithymum]|uniref:Retrotransposon Copia-like N-terminal domain-containing protein n=1 Tax=Cuscuta epithymum TaxID=186058 RepID=A0AAV0D729_9ASTE|nr:unnamed protein product [Cuscuta epithymum]